jgi:hypothetical protein
LNDSSDGRSVVLEVAIGRFLDTAEIQVDVQPLFVRCLIRGRLLQVHMPEVCIEHRCFKALQLTRTLTFSQEVCPGECSCQRSTVTGALVVTVLKVQKVVAACVAQPQTKRPCDAVASLHMVGGTASSRAAEAVAVPYASLTAVFDADTDEPPPLLS